MTDAATQSPMPAPEPPVCDRGRYVRARRLLPCCVLALAIGQWNCSGLREPIRDEAAAAGKTIEDFAAAAVDHFPELDLVASPGGTDGELRPPDLTPAVIRGRNTWMLWTGGNEAFWDWLASYNYGFIDLLKLVDADPRRPWPRFANAGLIVEPNTRVPRRPDRYGLYIPQPVDTGAKPPDESKYGRSSGIVGLRLFDNPNFDDAAAARWNVERYYNDPDYYLDPALVRPYRVGMSCGFCHVGPHPLNPPVNPEEPLWSNLSATIGNQYLRTRAVFGNLLKRDSYFYHLLDSQLPGTLDTSLIASDNINNPNAQNAIFELAGRLDRAGFFSHRPPGYESAYRGRYGTNPAELAGAEAGAWPVLSYDEKQPPANPRPVPRFLMDGADSVGPWAALARVYLNIGTFHQRWVTLHNPLFGYRRAAPFATNDASDNSVYWAATERLMEDVAKYLIAASSPMRLRDAPSGAARVKGQGVPWAPELASGRQVFASKCIVCHSSKQPHLFDQTPAADVPRLLDDPEYQAWALREVDDRKFWVENFLSTDRRLPVAVVGTNAARSLASNGLDEQMWQEFSSETYKRLPEVGPVRIWNPFSLQFESQHIPAGGRGYYRPPSLVGVWATAPFLHNNSVGIFNNDPSVSGRIAAFEDGIRKLLVAGPTEPLAALERQRLGSDLNGATAARLKRDAGLIWRLPQSTWIRVPASQVPHLIASTFGVSAMWLKAAWIVPIWLFTVAALCIMTPRRLRRCAGYLVATLAFVAAALLSFVSGHLVDPALGPIPPGLPVNVVANLDIDALKNEGAWNAAQRVWRVGTLIVEASRLPPNDRSSPAKVDELGAQLDAISRNRDHVMDKGHYFGATLTTQERQDLIDLLLTF